MRKGLEEEKPPISERKLIIKRKTSLQKGKCEIVLEKGKEVVVAIFGKTQDEIHARVQSRGSSGKVISQMT